MCNEILCLNIDGEKVGVEPLKCGIKNFFEDHFSKKDSVLSLEI